MKVRDRFIVRRGPALAGRIVAVLAALLALIPAIVPAPAAALTRPEVVFRARAWISKGVTYSQSSYFAGYRQDCSGFVSMAWGLGRSYTTRDIATTAIRVPYSQLRLGDAVLQPGHVQVFGGWKDKAAGTYVALEESMWGTPAHSRVKQLPTSGEGLRFRGIVESPISGIPTAPVASLLAELPAAPALSLYVLPPTDDEPDTATVAP